MRRHTAVRSLFTATSPAGREACQSDHQFISIEEELAAGGGADDLGHMPTTMLSCEEEDDRKGRDSVHTCVLYHSVPWTWICSLWCSFSCSLSAPLGSSCPSAPLSLLVEIQEDRETMLLFLWGNAEASTTSTFGSPASATSSPATRSTSVTSSPQTSSTIQRRRVRVDVQHAQRAVASSTPTARSDAASGQTPRCS
jgi:hypothetical protein